MDALLQGEIVKLLSENGQMHAGRIMNTLNGQPAGWDVSLEDVERAMRHFEATYLVECMWRLNETLSTRKTSGKTDSRVAVQCGGKTETARER